MATRPDAVLFTAGRASVVRLAADGSPARAATLAAGTLIGELALARPAAVCLAFTTARPRGMIEVLRVKEEDMAPIVSTIEISRRPEDVFAYVTDVPRFTEWQQGLLRAERADGEGGMKVGSKVRLTRRIGPREQTITTEVTDFTPPRSWAFRGIAGPIRVTGKGTIEPLGDESHSRLRFELDFEGRGLGKLLAPLARRQASRDLPASHQNLKTKLEAGA